MKLECPKAKGFTLSATIIRNLIQHDIIEKIWEGVAVNNIQRMAPQCARLQNQHIIESFVLFVSTEASEKSITPEEDSPTPACIDNLSSGYLRSEIKSKDRVNDSKTRKISEAYMSSKFSTNRSFMKKQHQDLLEKHKAIIDRSSFLTKVPELEQAIDSVEESYRKVKEKDQLYLKETQEFMKKKFVENQLRVKKSHKLMKDMKKITFDYQGQVSNAGNLADIDKVKFLKIKSDYSQNTLIHKDLPKPIIENLSKGKQQLHKTRTGRQHRDNFQPEFNEQGPKSILEIFGQQQIISSGVKITESINNQKVSKQTQRQQAIGLSKYHLSEFRQIAKRNKFNQHKHNRKANSQKILHQDQIQLCTISNKASSKQRALRSQNSLYTIEDSKTSHKSERLVDGLPPLRGGLKSGSKRLARASDKSFDMSRVSKKIEVSKILVENSQLYQENFKYFEL